MGLPWFNPLIFAVCPTAPDPSNLALPNLTTNRENRLLERLAARGSGTVADRAGRQADLKRLVLSKTLHNPNRESTAWAYPPFDRLLD
jgi:hypothetical protein